MRATQAALYGSARYVLFDWKPELGTTLHLVHLATGATRKLKAPPYFTFHYVNAFETEDGSALCFDFARCGPCRLACLLGTRSAFPCVP